MMVYMQPLEPQASIIYVLKIGRTYIGLCLLFLAVFLTGAAEVSAHEGRRDTSRALVVYDDEIKFVPDRKLDDADYTAMIDSLMTLDSIPLNLLSRLEIYRDLSKLDRTELYDVVDTLFESPHVTQAVINSVRTYLSAMEVLEGPALPLPAFAATVPYDDSPYPANAFYGDWNTEVPNPFRNDLTRFDSTLKLVLTDSVWSCDFHPPFVGVVTSHFGWRYGRNHNGIDIDLEVWDPVHSAFSGVVRVARYYRGFGRVVVVRHYNGLETLYAHLHRFKVEPGDVVEAGDVIGLGGSSGNSTGSHLHFEVRFQGVPIRPSQIIDFRTHTLRHPQVEIRRAGSFLAAVPRGRKHRVRKGDYLYKIAQSYGLSLEEICVLNGIRRSDPLRVGQVLIVGS